ncbi:eae-like domain protein [Enterobacter kobei]|uniref:eae-like domain protein n=1 Tax=Enterobacter kobei TaxID=208224 RepID=UPI00292C2DE1|nr:eae-like domain protein [Enterobacter kobei]MDV1944438.1 eae-like domain protein [Enterobacter kobei]
MTNKTKELVAAGHALAKELHCAESAALVRELATQLDVQLSRSNALAAENAGLKAAISSIHQELCGQGFEVAGWHLNGDLQPLDSWFEENNWNPETPATDAFLAEVRAQGVDAAIEELNQLAERSEKEAPIAAEHHRSAALYLQLLATQLRKGVQS